jgi:hypothetical protein
MEDRKLKWGIRHHALSAPEVAEFGPGQQRKAGESGHGCLIIHRDNMNGIKMCPLSKQSTMLPFCPALLRVISEPRMWVLKHRGK